MSDTHIVKLISDISESIDNEFQKLAKNFIFVGRANGTDNYIGDGFIPVDNGKASIPFTSIRTDDFSSVYSAFPSKTRIPANIIRRLKDNIYDIVLNNEAEEKIHVIEYDELLRNDNIEYVVGVGAIDALRPGYRMIRREDIVNDFLYNNQTEYNAAELLQTTIPEIISARNRTFTPVFKYLNQQGIVSKAGYDASGLKFDSIVSLTREAYRSNSVTDKRRYQRLEHQTFSEIMKTFPLRHAVVLTAFLSPDQIVAEKDIIFKFIQDNYNSDELNIPNAKWFSVVKQLPVRAFSSRK